jgi:heat shock protein HslJ
VPGSDAASSPEAGRTFLSTSVSGHTLLDGTRVVIAFDTRGTFSADAGCNSMGSGYAISDGHLRTVGPMGATTVGCVAALLAQDEWLSALLASKPTVTIAGDTLVITGDTATLTLLDKKTAEPDYPLIGTRWLVETIVQRDSASTPPQGAAGWVLFNADGTINVNFGCNSGSGTFASTSSELTVSVLQTTKLPCPSGAAQLETPMLDALTGTVSYAISADVLTLTSRGVHGLGLRAEQHP